MVIVRRTVCGVRKFSFFPSQGGRDTRMRESDPGAEATEAEKQTWRSLGEGFLAGLSQAAAEEDPAHVHVAKAQKEERVASHSALVQINWMLMCAKGHGILAYQPKAGDERPLQSREHLALIVDKGSDNWCLSWFLIYHLRLRVSVYPDPFHGPWRELENAISAGGKRHSLLLSSIVHNMDYGPFEGQAFWNQQRDSAKEPM